MQTNFNKGHIQRPGGVWERLLAAVDENDRSNSTDRTKAGFY
jgi:hypothetical protein